jgi:hypothetical protein
MARELTATDTNKQIDLERTPYQRQDSAFALEHWRPSEVALNARLLM